MTRPCALTGKKTGRGRKVSHANNKSIRRFHVNTRKERVTSELLQRSFRFSLSTRALRTIDLKGGFDAALLSRKRRGLPVALRRLQRELRLLSQNEAQT